MQNVIEHGIQMKMSNIRWTSSKDILQSNAYRKLGYFGALCSKWGGIILASQNVVFSTSVSNCGVLHLPHEHQNPLTEEY